MISNATTQFKKDFPLSVKFAVNHYRIHSRYAKDNDDDDTSITWEREGQYDIRTETIPERYGGGSFSYYYNRMGVHIGTSWYGELVEWFGLPGWYNE